MNKNIVVDTSVWCCAYLNNSNITPKYKEICKTVVMSFVVCDHLFIVWDDDGKIIEEYMRNLSRIRDFQIVYNNILSFGKYIYVSSKYIETVEKELIKNRFHEKEDHLFVFTALASDKIIVTEDSDYGVFDKKWHSDSYEYLTENLGLLLFDANSFFDTVIGG